MSGIWRMNIWSTVALDAGCSLVELCTSHVVEYDPGDAEVITYDAKSIMRGVSKHKDRDRDGDSSKQTNTLLVVTLDEAGVDYKGGGTRFWPRFHNSFLVRPGRGGGVTFSPDIEHEGVDLYRGRRHVIVVTTRKCTNTGDELEEVKAAQKRAALKVFGRIEGWTD